MRRRAAVEVLLPVEAIASPRVDDGRAVGGLARPEIGQMDLDHLGDLERRLVGEVIDAPAAGHRRAPAPEGPARSRASCPPLSFAADRARCAAHATNGDDRREFRRPAGAARKQDPECAAARVGLACGEDQQALGGEPWRPLPHPDCSRSPSPPASRACPGRELEAQLDEIGYATTARCCAPRTAAPWPPFTARRRAFAAAS